jgi:hypothetical protein
MSSFISPIIAEFSARLEEAVEQVKANILREFETATAIATELRAAHGSSKAKSQSAADAPPKGQKRTPEALALKVEEVFALIKRHPGLRIEQLGERSGMTTKEMVLPIKKLRAAKRIVASGDKRATTYAVRAAK